MTDKAITETIIGCAYKVYNTLGYGFLESVYEKSLLIEIYRQGLSAESQRPITVLYRGETVGEFVADIIVEGQVILELKSVSKLIKAHEVQLVNYLTSTGIDTGLLINFGENGVQVKRKIRKLEQIQKNEY